MQETDSPQFDFSEETSLKEFLIENIRVAMQEQGMHIKGALVVGGTVFRYFFKVTEIIPPPTENEVPH